jgi:tRNA dimethylallyltransferase
MKKQIIILSGPTASGKSALALVIARACNAVIINCDSKQLYAEIPIITAQPTAAEKAEVPHDLYGVISVAEDCSVGRWVEMAKIVIDKVHAAGKLPLLVGGTGMYVKALTEGIPEMPDIDEEIRRNARSCMLEMGSEAMYETLEKEDPVMAARLEKNDSQRITRAYEVLKQTGKSLDWWQKQPAKTVYPPENFLKFFLSPPREVVYANCNTRFEKMMEAGVMQEIAALDAMGLSPELPSMKAHGVPELLAYLHGEMSLEDAIDQAQKNTRHYIKRQFTWFRHQMKDTVVLEGEGAAEMVMKKIGGR